MTDKEIQRYLKVVALAEGGVSGEKDSAKKIVRELEKKYPGIKQAAEAEKRKQREQDNPPPPPQPTAQKGSWFDWLQSTVEQAREVVASVNDAAVGYALGEHVRAKHRIDARHGKATVSLSVPMSVLDSACELNSVQKELFKAAYRRELEAVLTELLD